MLKGSSNLLSTWDNSIENFYKIFIASNLMHNIVEALLRKYLKIIVYYKSVFSFHMKEKVKLTECGYQRRP